MRFLRALVKDILNNLDSFVLALFLAIVVWLMAVQQEDPIITADLPDPVPVEYVNLGEGLTIFGDPVEEVHITVRGQRSILESLTASAFQARVDLKGLGPGVHTVPIQVVGPKDVKILRVRPPKAVVHIEPLAQKEVPVRVEVLDVPPLGYMVRTDAITVEPMTVTVKGPAGQVSKVTAAVAEVFVQGRRSTFKTRVVLSPRDEENLPVFGVTVEPSTVEVTVPIEQQPGYLEVPVVPRTVGKPAPGYRVSSISVEPATVTLRGSPETLQRLPGYVETEPLDISGATGDVVERLPLKVPPNVSILGSKTVQVTVRITPLEGGKTVVRPLKLQGLPDGARVILPIHSVQIILAGPLPKLNSLRPEDVQVILDLSQVTGEGVFTLKPQVLTPADVRVETIIPEEIQVEVRMPTPTPTLTPTVSNTPTVTPLPNVYRPGTGNQTAGGD
ncbi:MAG: hypothetical protein GXO55_03560 [Chloroflexi bacterium]|nr:hypothetical protein [Chloroflexota bacterium]